MEIVPDYFFSQCSFEEQFIQITIQDLVQTNKPFQGQLLLYIQKLLTQNSVVLCIYAAVFNYAAP